MMQRFIKTGCKSTLLLLLVFTLTSAALAQYGNGRGGDFGDFSQGGPHMFQPPENLFKAMQAQGVASTITAGQLTADWRVITVGDQGLSNPAYFGYFNNSSQPALYYTNGEQFFFGEQRYLVAYTLQVSSDPDQRSAQQYYLDHGVTPERRAPQLLKESVLALSLLPLNQSESFHLIQQFDPAADIAPDLPQTVIDRNISQTNLKQIAMATFMYVQDYDEKLPPMVAARNANEIAEPLTVQARLMPYARNASLFLQPVTHRPYLPNYRVSRLSEAKIKNPSQVFLYYEDAPDSDGLRNVAYADGHVNAISEVDFQRERKMQGISASGYPPVARPRHKAKATPKPH